VSQDITLTDEVTASVGRVKDVSQALDLTATASSEASFSRPVSQGITIADGVTATPSTYRPVTQDITIADEVTATVARVKDVSQALDLTATTSSETSFSRSVSQGITIADGVRVLQEETVTESILVSDTVSGIPVSLGNSEQTILLSDVVSVTVIKGEVDRERAAGGGKEEVEEVVVVEPVSAVGFIDISRYLDARGRTTVDITLTSADSLATIFIPRGTNTLDAKGNPLESIEIIVVWLPPPPAGYKMVGPAYDCLPDGATFEPYITLTFTYNEADIPDRVSEEELVMAYHDGAKWVFLPATIDTITNAASAYVEHFTPFAILAKLPPPLPAPAVLGVSQLSVTPGEVEPGQKVTISATVSNTGGTEDTYEATLKIDGVVETTKKVTVAAGGSQPVSFSVSRDEAGTYKVALDGLSGAFVVATPAPPPVAPPVAPPGPNWALFGGIIAAVVLVSVLLVAVRPKITLFIRRITGYIISRVKH
jgi:hypothetical protein